MDTADLKGKIRDIKDFPTEGILFKDITTLLKDGPAFRYVIDTFVHRYQKERADVVVGMACISEVACLHGVEKLKEQPLHSLIVYEYAGCVRGIACAGRRVVCGGSGRRGEVTDQRLDAAQRRGADHRVA